MSRQMAFQLTEFQYKESLGHLVAWFGNGVSAESGRVKIGEMIDTMVPDAKKRDRYKAVLLIALRCHEAEVDPLRVKKIVCWRNDKGEPGLIEAEIDGQKANLEMPR